VRSAEFEEQTNCERMGRSAWAFICGRPANDQWSVEAGLVSAKVRSRGARCSPTHTHTHTQTRWEVGVCVTHEAVATFSEPSAYGLLQTLSLSLSLVCLSLDRQPCNTHRTHSHRTIEKGIREELPKCLVYCVMTHQTIRQMVRPISAFDCISKFERLL
jgi:hypothetical protein